MKGQRDVMFIEICIKSAEDLDYELELLAKSLSNHCGASE